jgi:hypothetical protein
MLQRSRDTRSAVKRLLDRPITLRALVVLPLIGVAWLNQPDGAPSLHDLVKRTEAMVRSFDTSEQDTEASTTTAAAAVAEPVVEVADVRAGAATLAVRTHRAELYAGGTGGEIATVDYWMKMAHCETATDWEDGGQYGGGLGIYVGTWDAWGGRDFAEHPADASIDEQIIVANRIATQGWVRPNGSFREPVWYRGWGALPCAGDPIEVSLNDPRAFTPGQLLMRPVLNQRSRN